jgi:hemolysin III
MRSLGASFVLVFSSSTLHRSVRGRRAKDFPRKMDHPSIYLLIAGSYILFARLKHAHGIWHLFLLAGSAAHFIGMLVHVV